VELDKKFQLEELLKRLEDLEKRLKYLENLLIGDRKK
tara:strand:+ start:814 stop:924 length:111 start_codon:yes stop_codon:yes gene_type:complete